MIKVIGIDPDMRKPGVCTMHDGEIADLGSMDTAYFLASVPWYIESGYTFACENVNQIKTMYARNRLHNNQVSARVAQNVGMVKAAGTIICDYITHLGGEVVMVPPGIGKQTKKNAKLFAQLTGHTKRTNEDTRDAYWIAKHVTNKLEKASK